MQEHNISDFDVRYEESLFLKHLDKNESLVQDLVILCAEIEKVFPRPVKTRITLNSGKVFKYSINATQGYFLLSKWSDLDEAVISIPINKIQKIEVL